MSNTTNSFDDTSPEGSEDNFVRTTVRERGNNPFAVLSVPEFGTNTVEVCVEKEGIDGETEIGVQVFSHKTTFDETHTEQGSESDFLAKRIIEFDDGLGCFEIGNPGVSGVLFTLFPFNRRLETVEDIDRVAVAVNGETPDAVKLRGVNRHRNEGPPTA